MTTKDYLKVVPKGSTGKQLSETVTLVDLLKSIGDIRQELFDMFEAVELLEEDVKQTLYRQQGNKKDS